MWIAVPPVILMKEKIDRHLPTQKVKEIKIKE